MTTAQRIESKRAWLRRMYAMACARSVNVAIVFISKESAIAVFTRTESVRNFTAMHPEYKARKVHLLKWRIS